MAQTENEAEETWRTMMQALHRARRVMQPLFREHDLNGARYAVLRHLLEAGDAGIRLGELGARMVVTQSNITGLVDQLEALGCATRCADPGDRRSTILRITPVGQQAVDSIQPAIARRAVRLLACLSPEEAADLQSMLRRISNTLAELSETDCNQE